MKNRASHLLGWGVALVLGLMWPGNRLPAQSKPIRLLAARNDYPTAYYNDVWGYVDTSGLEYAVLGVQTGVAIYSLENPAAPIHRVFIPGVRSIWRDMKSFGGYLYAIADQGREGLLVVDMRAGPERITWQYQQPVIQGIPLLKAHNLHIDEKGRLCLSGSNLNNGGVVLFDVATAPGLARFLGFGPNRYSHDCVARGDTLWSADVYMGEFSVVDIRDPASPQLLATFPTGRRFTHNCWLSADGKTLFTTDEVAQGQVESYDVSNLDDIRKLDGFLPPTAREARAIPHNVHVHEGFLVTSWYTEGLVILDAHNPEILVETERYRTYTGGASGFAGCWGAFPFLPSGVVLASDIETGLYVLAPTYSRAAYIKGQVADAESGVPIAGARVSSRAGLEENSDLDGLFKGGVATDLKDVLWVQAVGYLADSVVVRWQPGVVQEVTVKLKKETVTGLISSESLSKSGLKAYPNPSSGPVRLTVSAGEVAVAGRLVIRDTTGRQWHAIRLEKGRSYLDLELASGVYIAGWFGDGMTPAFQTIVVHP